MSAATKTALAPITAFRGEFRFLSNFWQVPVEFEGVVYPTSEHAFQAAKTIFARERAFVLSCTSAGEAKRMGRLVTMRPGWDAMRVSVMKKILTTKFHDAELRRRLTATGARELVEGNTWGDRFWGAVFDGRSFEGENHLGRLLMGLRTEVTAPAHDQAEEG